MLNTIDGFLPSFDCAALLDDHSLALPSTDRAKINQWRSLAREHNSLFMKYVRCLMW